MQSRGLTIIELAAVMALLAVGALVLLPMFARPREIGCGGASCQNNLKQWGLVMKMYSNEAKGEKYPPMQVGVPGNPDVFAFAASPDVSAVYPEYLTDPSIIVCPSDPDVSILDLQDTTDWDNDGDVDEFILAKGPDLIDESYLYLGWAFDQTDTPALALSRYPKLADALPRITGMKKLPKSDPPVSRQIAAAFDTMLGDIDLDKLTPAQLAELVNQDIKEVFDPAYEDKPFGNGGSSSVFRLREGIERFMITDINNTNATANAEAQTWFMMDRLSPYSVKPRYQHRYEQDWGSNVLYLDGHVDFIPYTGAPFQGPPHDFAEDIGATQPVSSSVIHMLALLAMDE